MIDKIKAFIKSALFRNLFIYGIIGCIAAIFDFSVLNYSLVFLVLIRLLQT